DFTAEDAEARSVAGPPRLRGSAVRSSVFAQDRDDDAADLARRGVDDERLQGVVGRLQADAVAAFAVEALDRRRAVDDGDDGLAVVRGRALLDDDVVAIEDAVLDHRVADDLEHER